MFLLCTHSLVQLLQSLILLLASVGETGAYREKPIIQQLPWLSSTWYKHTILTTFLGSMLPQYLTLSVCLLRRKFVSPLLSKVGGLDLVC